VRGFDPTKLKKEGARKTLLGGLGVILKGLWGPSSHPLPIDINY